MKAFYLFIFVLALQSCATKKYTDIHQLPKGIKSATEKKYVKVNDQKKLVHTKQMDFTKNGRIKYSKTTDGSGKLVQETNKKLWFVKETYPDKETYYCKTRWKPNQRERISCYIKKREKQNDAIYHYNKNGTIDKIVDNTTPFNTYYFDYTNNELSKITTKDQKDKVVDELLISCTSKDDKGTCLKQIRTSTKKDLKEEIVFTPTYN